MNHEKTVIYTCPMHPEVKQEKPGICPQCGMNLLPSKVKSEVLDGAKHAHHNMEEGFNKHEGHNVNIFARKFYISLVLTIPVVIYSELPQRLLSWTAPSFPGSQYLGFILGSIVFFYGGWVFLIGAFRELRAKLPGMMTLIAIAITAAYLFSAYATFAGLEHTLFWELTTLITIMLLGHWIEMRAVQGSMMVIKVVSSQKSVCSRPAKVA
jgi:Cu2+-exporting ATPase